MTVRLPPLVTLRCFLIALSSRTSVTCDSKAAPNSAPVICPLEMLQGTEKNRFRGPPFTFLSPSMLLGFQSHKFEHLPLANDHIYWLNSTTLEEN